MVPIFYQAIKYLICYLKRVTILRILSTVKQIYS